MSSITRNEIINASIRLTEADCGDVRDEVIQFITAAALRAIEPPASAVEEAARMYPDVDESTDYASDDYRLNEVKKFQRLAHITCAGMYTGEIETLKAENSNMRNALEGVRMSANRAGWNNHDPVKELEYIEKTATEALKTT